MTMNLAQSQPQLVYFKNGSVIFRQQGFSLKVISVKHRNHQYLHLKAKIVQSKTHLFSQSFKVAECKVPSFFYFWPPGRDIDN